MERIEIETWFTEHPEAIATSSSELLDASERAVRHHAHHDAWIHARDVARHMLSRFDHGFGLPASESFVTREVCHELARELRHNEPHLDELREDEWVQSEWLRQLSPEGRSMLRTWIKDLAEREEHETWTEIVHFTDHLARKLIRDGRLSNRLEWDMERTYPRLAARVARMLIHEFELHAGPEEAMGGRRGFAH